jgi:hypothetical protein
MKHALAGIGGAFTTKDRWSGHTVLRTWVRAALVVAVIGAIICGAVYGITQAVRSAGAASCRTFARQSGYGSTYRIQHFLDSGTCYVHMPNGHQLPEKNITGFIKANG